MFVFAVLSPGNEALESGWVRIPVHVHQEGRRHEVRGLLGLLIQHIVVGVSDQWTEVCMEEHLFGDL